MSMIKRPPLTNVPGRVVIADRALREKPEACWKCPVANEYTMCMLSSKVYEDLDRQYEDCPLIEIELDSGEGSEVKVMSELIRKEDALKAVRGYFKGEIEKTPTGMMDGEEVYTDMDAVDRILEQNKAICKAIESIPEVKV